ncbi:MAG: hypothetical protein HY097_03675 [Nitrospinae bacterium]|nr:hypothetical protein [Nitrospinota bacterium]
MFWEDTLDIQSIRDIGNMKLLIDILSSKVGSLPGHGLVEMILIISFFALSAALRCRFK